MSYLINNQQKINDIIFAEKNKNYGAYAIRSTYGNTVVKSLSFMLLGFGALMSVALYMSNRNGNNNNNASLSLPPEQDTTTYVVQVNIPEEQPVSTEQQHTESSSSSAESTSTLISESATVEATSTESIGSTGTGTTSVEGPEGPPSGTTTITGTTTISTPTVDTPVHFWDSAPEFEGGLRALYAFVSSKLKYPALAIEAGKEGISYVKFVVDQNGKVGNLSLQNNLGYGLDEEAIRVVGLIPNFKTPGMVNGKPVKVYYQLPIKFKMR